MQVSSLSIGLNYDFSQAKPFEDKKPIASALDVIKSAGSKHALDSCLDEEKSVKRQRNSKNIEFALQTIKYANGDEYIGYMQGGCRHGYGEIRYANGDSYKGEHKQGMVEGQGTYIWANQSQYEGEFRANKRAGKGTFTFANQDKYEGDYIDDRKHGLGILTYVSGSVYAGKFAHGLKHGKGRLKWISGNEFDGEFKFDKPFQGVFYLKAKLERVVMLNGHFC
jgi:hypothetical protein